MGTLAQKYAVCPAYLVAVAAYALHIRTPDSLQANDAGEPLLNQSPGGYVMAQDLRTGPGGDWRMASLAHGCLGNTFPHQNHMSHSGLWQ